jgi:hypothetical protein
MAYWNLDEGAGTVVRDRSGNGNHGTVHGATWTQGRYKGALEFNGVDNYVEVPASESLAIEGHVTIAAWIRWLNAGDVWLCIMANGQQNGPWENYGMFVNRDSRFVYFTLSLDGGHVVQQTPNNMTEPDQWQHVCASWDGAAARVYVDGEMRLEQAQAGSLVPPRLPLRIGHRTGSSHYYHGMIDDVAVFDHALTEQEVQRIMEGLAPAELASDPRPEDEAVDVPRDEVLRWAPGEFAATHDVYFGTSFDDVNDASRSDPRGTLVSQGQTAAGYDPAGLLDFGTTYHWRIDEVNAPPSNTIYTGEVWSFTTEPFAYPVTNVLASSNGVSEAAAGPQNTVNGSGLNAADQHSTNSADMWLARPGDEPLYIQYEFDRVYKLHQMLVWNYNVQFELLLGFGLKDVTVEHSIDAEDWTVLGDVELARATASATYEANTTVAFDGVAARYVRLTVNSGWGTMGQLGLSEVRFLFIPAQPREPKPADGDADVEVGSSLSWRAGRDAISHEVYLGEDADGLALAGTVAGAALAPGNLEFGSTYYWRVDAINPADANPVWSSATWSFSTQEYAWIDGFETYDDAVDAGTAIFDTWLDGWVNNTGSTVGYLNSPFAERTIVRTGRQSMPLQYDNTNSPFYSEAERAFDTSQNWTGNGADTLVLYVHGNAPGFLETADGIIMNAIGADIWDSADQFRFAYRSLSGDGSIVVRVDSVVRSHEWAKAGVMIRETLEPGSRHAFVAVTPTPSHGISFQRRPVAAAASANTDVADIAIPHWVKLTRTGNVFTAQQSEDGVNWVDITLTAPVEIPMATNVYIGLALTSHDIAISTAAEFSNLTIAGAVTGDWQMAEIGAVQPMGNSAESMYVRVEDATGQSATVVSADEAITARPSWQQWRIPYGSLAGVNLSRVQKVFIGVGSKTTPTAGGKGTVYVDDVGYGRPAETE